MSKPKAKRYDRHSPGVVVCPDCRNHSAKKKTCTTCQGPGYVVKP